MIYLLIIIWLLCGTISSLIYFNYQKKHSYGTSIAELTAIVLFGTISLIIILLILLDEIKL